MRASRTLNMSPSPLPILELEEEKKSPRIAGLRASYNTGFGTQGPTNLNGTALGAQALKLHGSPKKRMATELDYFEQERLREAVDVEMQRLKDDVEKKYADRAGYLPMLGETLNEIRSEIMKKITLAKAKRKAIPNVKRVERESIMHDRLKVPTV